jgi:hypothetical protein
VEEQQAQAAAGTTKVTKPLTAEQARRQRERDGLLLSRGRVLQQLQAAQNPAYRKMLQNALAELDSRLAQLG